MDRWIVRGGAALVLAAGLSGQSPVQVDLQVLQDVFVSVEHLQLSPQSRDALAAPAALPFQAVQSLAARSGACDGSALVRTTADPFNGIVECLFVTSLPTLHSGAVARGESGADLVAVFRTPAPTRGALSVLIDLRHSTGQGTLGEYFVDIDNDGTFEIGLAGTAAAPMVREFPLTVSPTGTAVRIRHRGLAIGDNTAGAGYRASLSLTFLPNVSPVVPYRTGCGYLPAVRWASGQLSVGFGPPQPGVLNVLTIGAPRPPRAVVTGPNGLLGSCPLVNSLDAVMIVPGLAHTFPRTLLPGSGQAVIQGFTFANGTLRASDSWLVN